MICFEYLSPWHNSALIKFYDQCVNHHLRLLQFVICGSHNLVLNYLADLIDISFFRHSVDLSSKRERERERYQLLSWHMHRKINISLFFLDMEMSSLFILSLSLSFSQSVIYLSFHVNCLNNSWAKKGQKNSWRNSCDLSWNQLVIDVP